MSPPPRGVKRDRESDVPATKHTQIKARRKASKKESFTKETSKKEGPTQEIITNKGFDEGTFDLDSSNKEPKLEAIDKQASNKGTKKKVISKEAARKGTSKKEAKEASKREASEEAGAKEKVGEADEKEGPKEEASKNKAPKKGVSENEVPKKDDRTEAGNRIITAKDNKSKVNKKGTAIVLERPTRLSAKKQNVSLEQGNKAQRSTLRPARTTTVCSSFVLTNA